MVRLVFKAISSATIAALLVSGGVSGTAFADEGVIPPASTTTQTVSAEDNTDESVGESAPAADEGQSPTEESETDVVGGGSNAEETPDGGVGDGVEESSEPEGQPIDGQDDGLPGNVSETFESQNSEAEDSEPTIGTRIYGGTNAAITDAPWQVALLGTWWGATNNYDAFFCGGSIVHREWILTAAHCVEGLDPFDIRVLAGTATLSKTNLTGSTVSRILIHEGYDGRFANDIALIQLSSPLTLSASVSIIPLASEVSSSGTTGQITGWGQTDKLSNREPSTLQKASVQIFSDAYCQSGYGSDFISAQMLCAADASFTKDTCFGDSGGPLAVVVGGQRVLAGVTSWGATDNGECSVDGYPGVYAEVANYYSWIAPYIASPPESVTAPTLSGSPAVGFEITASPGTWRGFPAPILSYSWFLCDSLYSSPPTDYPLDCSLISTDGGPSYTVQEEDLGRYILVAENAENDSGVGVAFSRSTNVVNEFASFTRTPVPTITGVPADGQSIRVQVGSWLPTPDSFSYQWLRNGSPISGATASSYLLTKADRGKKLSVRVTAEKENYVTAEVTSARTVTVGQRFSKRAAKVSGSTVFGSTLKATPGDWGTKSVKFTYRWFRNGQPISQATKSTYKLTAADVGKTIHVEITGSKSGFTTESKASSKTKKVSPATFKKVKPTISGQIGVGKTLKASPGNWGTSSVKHSYQWLRDGKAISGATKSSYKLTRTDAGKKISVQITGTKSGYKTLSQTSSSRNDWKRVTKTKTVRANSVFPADTCNDVGFSYRPCDDGSWLVGPGGAYLYSSGFGDVMAVAGNIKLDGSVQRWRLTFNNVKKLSGAAFPVFASGSNPADANTWSGIGGFSRSENWGGSYRTNWSKKVSGDRAHFVIGSLDWGSVSFQSITIEYETIQ
jgi:secreted trypsin-like serine protease